MKKFISAEKAFKVLYLTGNPYRMGFQHGELMREEIHYAINHCYKIWAVKLHGWPDTDMHHYARNAFKQADKRMQDELKGIAAGAGLSLDDILCWNYLDDYYELFQCTAFAVHNRFTADGEMLIGRNNDYEIDLSTPISVSIVRVPEQGLPSLCHTWAGTVGAYEGINLAGLVTATQFSETQDKNLYGKAIKQVNLTLLETCSDLRTAIETLYRTPRNFGSNILIADTENAAVVECSGKDLAIRREKHDYIVATNHFCELVPAVPQLKNSFLTEERKQYMTDTLIKHVGLLDVEYAKRFLSERPIGRQGNRDYFTTRSAIYQPQKATTHVAQGLLPAYLGPYITLDLNKLLHKDAAIEHINLYDSVTT